jgi:NADPH2:quinone reductase
VFFTRPHLADYLQPHEVQVRAAELFSLVGQRRLEVALEKSFPLAEAAEAHRHLEARRTRGKLLLDVGAA